MEAVHRQRPSRGGGAAGAAVPSFRWASGERPTLDSVRTRPPADGGSPIDLDALVQANLVPIVVGLAAAIFVLLLLVIVQALRIRRLGRRLDALTGGSDGSSLEAVLGVHLDRVRAAVSDVERVAARTTTVERDLRRSLGRIGLVRFNPFEDTGGNQSFALAILDARGDGFVVSSLHARAGTRVYAKAITGGLSEGALSKEESEALRQALAKPAAGALS